MVLGTHVALTVEKRGSGKGRRDENRWMIKGLMLQHSCKIQLEENYGISKKMNAKRLNDTRHIDTITPFFNHCVKNHEL